MVCKLCGGNSTNKAGKTFELCYPCRQAKYGEGEPTAKPVNPMPAPITAPSDRAIRQEKPQSVTLQLANGNRDLQIIRQSSLKVALGIVELAAEHSDVFYIGNIDVPKSKDGKRDITALVKAIADDLEKWVSR